MLLQRQREARDAHALVARSRQVFFTASGQLSLEHGPAAPLENSRMALKLRPESWFRGGDAELSTDGQTPDFSAVK
jgi:hypothetical protein